MNVGDQPPDEYERFVIEDVRLMGETLTLAYGGHIFGGIVRCLLDADGVEDALRPGTEIFVRYHSFAPRLCGQLRHGLFAQGVYGESELGLSDRPFSLKRFCGWVLGSLTTTAGPIGVSGQRCPTLPGSEER